MATAMRLGELLVQDRVITVAQLESALRAQILYGGRLGTNLIEAKVLTLDALAAALAKLHGVTIATQRQFDRIDPRTVALISRDLAKRRLAIPLGITKTGRRLAVAFCDPRNQEAVAEIGFVCKMSVVPNVAPELRILNQLEKRYGVARPNRYLRIVEEVVPIELPVERRGHVDPFPEVTLAVEVQAPLDLPKPPPPPAPPPPKVKDGRPAAFEMPEVNMPALRPPVPAAAPKPQPAVAPPAPEPAPAPVAPVAPPVSAPPTPTQA